VAQIGRLVFLTRTEFFCRGLNKRDIRDFGIKVPFFTTEKELKKLIAKYKKHTEPVLKEEVVDMSEYISSVPTRNPLPDEIRAMNKSANSADGLTNSKIQYIKNVKKSVVVSLQEQEGFRTFKNAADNPTIDRLQADDELAEGLSSLLVDLDKIRTEIESNPGSHADPEKAGESISKIESLKERIKALASKDTGKYELKIGVLRKSAAQLGEILAKDELENELSRLLVDLGKIKYEINSNPGSYVGSTKVGELILKIESLKTRFKALASKDTDNRYSLQIEVLRKNLDKLPGKLKDHFVNALAEEIINAKAVA